MIENGYVLSMPSHQNAVDIFEGEWSSKIPLEGLKSGELLLFDGDRRPVWAAEVFGGIQGYAVLELGPLEGAHTYQLEKLGAKTVLAIESNVHAYLRCLIVKEIFGLKAKFLLGDFCKYLAHTDETCDLIFCCGVLYHMTDPVSLIRAISKRTTKVFVWTHYFDKEIINQKEHLKAKFDHSKARNVEVSGFNCRYHEQAYLDDVNQARFCGGSAATSNWLERDDIFRCLDYFGFSKIETTDDNLDHPNGPAISIAAQKPFRVL